MALWLMRSKEGRGRGLKNKKREEERGERARAREKERESFRTAWSADREKGRGTEGRREGNGAGGVEESQRE